MQGGFTYAVSTRDGDHSVVATLNGDWGNPMGALIDITAAELCPAR